MKVAIIPARGGSKRIPNKNIKDFCGKPMIAWSIEAAKNSHCFDRIIVSTDDDAIADVAKEIGAEVPFMRPQELSNDITGTSPVVRHAIQWLQENNNKIDYACCIYATAPFVCPGDICQGMTMLEVGDADYAFTVTAFSSPIQRAYRMTQGGRLQMFQPQNFLVRSQDLEPAYHDAGQFYWGTGIAWVEERPMHTGNALPVCLPSYRVQDIDTLEDWRRAELLFQVLQKHNDELQD